MCPFYTKLLPFLLSSIYIRRKHWIHENFRHSVLENVCLSVCLHVSPNFVVTVSHEKIREKSGNFVFSCTLIKTDAD